MLAASKLLSINIELREAKVEKIVLNNPRSDSSEVLVSRLYIDIFKPKKFEN